MVFRFCLYSVLKNLRFADPFLAIYLLQLDFSFTQIGTMLGFEKLVTALIEIPSGYAADHWGRRTVLAWSFICHAVGMSLLAIGAGFDSSRVWCFFSGFGIYGVGEAFRTGSHKAIMLDYLELVGRKSESTSILGLARTYSKVSSAVAGVSAGAILFLLGDYRPLFWLSSLAAVGGCLLILSYPKTLEGETSRVRSGESINDESNSILSLLQNRQLWPLLIRSLIYESQVQVILKLFLQPFLHQGLSAIGFQLPDIKAAANTRSIGSIFVGCNELFRDSLGAIGAKKSGQVETSFHSRTSGLNSIYLLTTRVTFLICVSAFFPRHGFLPGLIAVGLLTFIQNLRRPIFVSALNEIANRPLRATILSIDSQTRSFVVALQLPLAGWIADQFGLWSVPLGAVLLLIIGMFGRSAENTVIQK